MYSVVFPYYFRGRSLCRHCACVFLPSKYANRFLRSSSSVIAAGTALADCFGVSGKERDPAVPR